MFGTDMGFTDAFFEAMSGFTTTGATVINNLETLPKGLLLWRALMQWFGGIGVIVVAMVFLPILRIGGMQIFRLEGFDTFGKILPRAAEIARSILGIYLLLTFLCFLAYSLVGLGYFDAISHAMTTIATGGFANYDAIHTGQGQTFALSAFITGLCGLVLTLACQSQNSKLNIQQTFILTTGIWVVLPFFGALPFMFGTDMGFTDAFFEAMSGFTTTGATVINNLETLPKGLLLWRALMQWFGGIGVIVVAMVFLPILRIGGMQIFRLEGFDTFGKILPRAAEIARSILGIYLLLTFLCFLAYSLVGLGYFDAISHAMTTIATGGFANYDAIHTGQGQTFALSAFITGLCGLVLTLACQSQNSKLNIQQTFILTTGIWVVLPFFGALPFMFGTDMGFTDAFLRLCQVSPPRARPLLTIWKRFPKVCCFGEH